MINKIPLIKGNQEVKVVLTGKYYNIRIIWREDKYIIDIKDNNNIVIVGGLTLSICDDILEQLTYLGLLGKLYLINNTSTENLTYDGLSTDYILVWED